MASEARRDLCSIPSMWEPGSKPFREGFSNTGFIREKINAKIEDEFFRYSAIINDPSTPVTNLEVITNEPRAVPYFEDLLEEYNIPGQVVVKP